MVLETYYRKRSKKALEMKQGEPPVLSRQLSSVPLPPPSSDHCSTHLLLKGDGDRFQMLNDVKPGYLYEIDHVHLPPRTPVQLKSIRVAMVCEKTELSVGIRFPSMKSLGTFLNYTKRETHPTLDDKFVMGNALAAKVLARLVPSEVFVAQKSLVSFWLITASPDGSVKQKKGNGLAEVLKTNGIVRWGIRRQVRYLGRHKEECGVNGQNSFSSLVHGSVEDSDQMALGPLVDGKQYSMEVEEEEETDGGNNGGIDATVIGDGGEKEEESEEKDEGEEDDEEEEEKINDEDNTDLKRKRYSFRNLGKKPKEEQVVSINKKKKQKIKNQTKKKRSSGVRSYKDSLVLKDPKNRWSAERYKQAEQNLLVVMKQKGATAEKPILRPQLRVEARKKIGDTGLLDHLLKHMAGKLAPGGKERFRRRHNPDGAMEYWLEDADLVNIRREAGVTDPYWVPPPGWKPGDSPTQDPIFAREFNLLKDDISKIKRSLEFMATKIQLEEEVGKLRRELEVAYSKRRQEESQEITVAPSGTDICQKLDQLVNSLGSSKCDFGNTQVSVERYKEQLIAISDVVKEIEEKTEKLTPNEEERTKAKDSSLMAPTETQQKSTQQVEVQALMAANEEAFPEPGKGQNKSQKAAEAKAAKIQRLKSGFRICRPHGTFLWPNMVNSNINNSSSSTRNTMSSQVVVQVEVPTPPSVSSSTASAPPQLPYHPHHRHVAAAGLVKPVAEKRAVKVKVSTGNDLINLNDAPTNHNALPPPSVAANRIPAWESGGYGPRNEMCYDHMKEYTACCGCSSSATSVGNWLALSSLKSASDESSHG